MSNYRVTISFVTEGEQSEKALDSQKKKIDSVGESAEKAATKTKVAAEAVKKAFGDEATAVEGSANRKARATQSAQKAVEQSAAATTRAVQASAAAQKAATESDTQAAARIKAMVTASIEKQRALYADVAAQRAAADAERATTAALQASDAARRSSVASVDNLRASADAYMAEIRALNASMESEAKTLAQVAERRVQYKAALDNGIISENEHTAALKALEQQENRIQKEMQESATQLQNLIAKYDPADAALKRITEDEKRLTAARDAGTISQEKYNRAMNGLTVQRAKWEVEARGINQAAGALGKLKLGSNEAITSYATMVGMISRGEWGQLSQSVAGATGRLGIARFAFTAVGGAILAVVAALGSFAVAAVLGYNETTRLNQAIIATGNFANTSAADLQDMGDRLGELTGRYGPARTAIEQLVASGKVGGDVLEDAAQGAVDFARVTGRSIDEAVAAMTRLSDDPAAAARELDKQYHFLTASTYQQIRALQEEGRTVEATALAYEVLSDEFANRREQVNENLGWIEQAWKSLGDTASAAWDSMLGVGRAASVEDQIAEQVAVIQRAQNNLADLQSGGKGGGYALDWVDSLFGDDAATKFANLTTQITMAQVRLGELRAEQEGAGQSTSMLDERVKQGIDSLDKYSASALSNVDAAKKTKAAALEAAIAREIEKRSVGLSAAEQEKLARAIITASQASIDRAQAIDGEMAAEAAHTAAIKAKNKAIKDAEDLAKDRAKAEADYWELMAQSAEQERDYLAARKAQQAQFDADARSLQNEISLLGLSGDARTKLAIAIQAEEMARDSNGNVVERERQRFEKLLTTYQKAADIEAIIVSFEFNGFEQLLDNIDKLKEQLEEATDPERVKRLEKAIGNAEQQAFSFATDAVGQGIESLKSLATEGTSAYRALETAQLALNVVSAIGAVLEQGKGDPYTAFARMAAMAAAVGALVGNIAFGGGSGGFSNTAAQRQERQGTGTVLGYAESKSESIANSLENVDNATSELVGINRGMLRALQTLQSGIGAASGQLARGAGNAEFSGLPSIRNLSPIGSMLPGGGLLNSLLGGSAEVTDQGIVIVGGLLNDLIENIAVGAYQQVQSRSWRFGSRRTREETVDVTDELGDQFSLIIESITRTVREGALALGMLPDEIETALARFRVEEIRISLKDLKPEEQQAELEAVFGSIFDGLAGHVVPFLPRFQQLGEGLGETLVRVATSVQVVQEAMGQLGFRLDTLDPEKLAEVSVGLVEMMGGVEGFIEGLNSFVNNFASDEDKFEIAQDALTRAFGEAGLTIPATRDAMWDLMQSLDATTESGRAHIALLLQLAGAADEYYNGLEAQAERAARRAATVAGGVDGLRSMYAAPVGARDAAIAEVTEAYEEYKKQLDEIKGTVEEYAALQAEYEAALIRANEAIDAQINDFLEGLAFESMTAGMNALDAAAARINRQFDEYREQLEGQQAGVARLLVLEQERAAALERSAAALNAQNAAMLDNVEFDLDLAEMSESEAAVARINRQYDGYRQQIIDTTNSATDLERVERLRARALEQLNSVQSQAAEYANQLRDALAVLGDSLQALIEKFTGKGMRDIVETATGLSPRAAAAPSRADALADIGGQYGAQVLSLTQQLTAAQAALARANPYNTPERTTLQAKIRMLQSALSQVNGAMEDALEYAAELYAQALDDLMGELREEFGTNDPIADINERFDDLIERAQDYGATMEELAEIEQYRIQALLRAEEEAYEQERSWIESLRNLRESLLTDQNVSILTPAERLAEVQRQYLEARDLAASGDAEARANFESIARRYAEELRGFYGSTDAYTTAFQRILDDIDALLDAGALVGVPPNPQTAPGSTTPTTYGLDPDSGPVQVLTVGAQNTVDELRGLRTDAQEQHDAQQALIQELIEQVAALTRAQQQNTNAIKAGNDRNNVRSN